MRIFMPINSARGSSNGGGGTPLWMKGGFVIMLAITALFVGPNLYAWAIGDVDGDGIPNWMDPIINPPEGGVSLKGEIYPYVEPYATDDTTDIDGAGTYEFWYATSNPTTIEPALTWGTDTHTTKDYGSDQDFYFVCKSTTANAFDHFVWKVRLPYADDARTEYECRDTRLYDIEWDAVNEYWTIHFYAAQEATITTKGYTVQGVEVGTTAIDMSDNDYKYTVTLKITIGTNYDALAFFFDPDEDADGQMDSLYLIMTSNVSVANMGFDISTPSGEAGEWTACQAGNDFYLLLDPYIKAQGKGYEDYGIFVRWDEQQMYGTLTVQFTIESADLDTSGSGDLMLTVDIKECQDSERAIYQTWETDTLTNFAAGSTAETIEFTD